MDTLCIASCGKAKIWDKHPELGSTKARDAYIGVHTGLCRKYAERFYPGSWIILSAKYGFLLAILYFTDFSFERGIVMFSQNIPVKEEYIKKTCIPSTESETRQLTPGNPPGLYDPDTQTIHVSPELRARLADLESIAGKLPESLLNRDSSA